jgi:outer membrane protein TolC
VQEVEAFKQRVNEAKAGFFPKVDSSYSFQHLKDQPYAEFFSMRVPTAPSNINHWEINLSQPLFTGFGLTAQLNISKMDVIVAQQKLDETRLNLVRDILHTFWQTLLAERLLQVAKDSVSSLEVHRENADAYFKQGIVVQNDVLKAEVALSQARQNERKATKQLVVLRSKLNQLLDRDLQAKINLVEGDMAPSGVPELKELYDRAEEHRPEYLSIQTTLRQIDENIKAAKSSYYPHLKAFAQYYREGSDFFADRNDYTNPEQAAVGVRLDWNLFEGGRTDATVKEFLYRKQSIEERKRDLVQQIRLQVEDAYEQLQVARDNIDTARTALKQAQENERLTTLQYKQQMVIFLEVLNAQVFVTQTQVDYNQALYGYQLAHADLERAIGGPLNDK